MSQNINTVERNYFIDTLMAAAARTITDYSPEWECTVSGAEGEPLELSPLEGHVAHIEDHTLVIRPKGQDAGEVRISRDDFGVAMDDWGQAISLLPPIFTLASGEDARIIVNGEWGLAEAVSDSTALCIAEHAHTTVSTGDEATDTAA